MIGALLSEIRMIRERIEGLNLSLPAIRYAEDTGSTDAYAITIQNYAAYAKGDIFTFKANTANTTAATLNVNGLGAKTIKKNGSTTDLATGDISAEEILLVCYDGTNFQWLNK